MKSALKSTKVLVAEDDSVMVSLIRDVLGVFGFGEIVVAKDGRDAIKEILKQDFDLVFCDWNMPEVNGIEFTRTVRRLPHYEKCAVPIIMVTGKATIEDVKTARDAGVNEYLAKPFSINMLCDKVKSVIENPRNYVLSDTYSGPDRRRRDDTDKMPTPDRRKGEETIES